MQRGLAIKVFDEGDWNSADIILLTYFFIHRGNIEFLKELDLVEQIMWNSISLRENVQTNQLEFFVFQVTHDYGIFKVC